MTEPKPAHPSQQSLLLAIFQDVAEIKTAMKTVQDHEDRIRELEKMVWRSSWLTGLVSAILASVIVAGISSTIGN